MCKGLSNGGTFNFLASKRAELQSFKFDAVCFGKIAEVPNFEAAVLGTGRAPESQTWRVILHLLIL